MTQLNSLLKNQKRIALANCGLINPESIEEYIACNGYFALEKVLNGMKPQEVIDEVKKSGLRGRGGGGFPTGLKWEFAAKSPGDIKYIICNGDEGDPGAFMDRSILEGDPHAVIEGMVIAGYAIGASKGYVYARAEYPLAVARLKKAIKDAKEMGLLGDNLFQSGFSFDLEIRLGAGAFVCGEETALIASIEGKRGEPRPKPPFPAQSGLFGKPTIINNVETLANVPAIIRNGWEWFSSIGTEKSKGTKVFALAGKIVNNGLIEVPMGTNLGEVIFDIGGGVPGGKKFKAAQTGGPSGGCIPAQHLNVPIDYESLTELGTIMGSGGLIIMDEDTCMVDLAKFFLDFIKDESCGKCTACRSGTARMLEILDRITKGEGQDSDIELLEELGQSIKDSALCGLGQSAPNPVLSTIRYFRQEYEEHIKDKYCRASVCATMFHSSCHNSCPAGIDIPIYVDLIRQRKYLDAYRFIKRDNPLPLICGRVCHHPCESKCNRGKIDDPISIRNLKRFAADYAFENGPLEETVPVIKKDVKVAVVGSGPAGLTCAYYLAKKGYKVTIFEEQPIAGGMLASVIPEYRLPKARLQAEIDTIKATGVEIRTNCGVGVDKDITLERLKKDGYQAIFLAVGTQLELKLNQPGEDLDGVVSGITFLTNINLGPVPNLTGKTVAVIGGGNVAIDAARCAARVGAKDVHIIYRRTKEDMPAMREEIREAENEGIQIHTQLASKRVLGENGKVTALECVRMRGGNFDMSGRRKAIPIEGSEIIMPVDMVIVAVGQTLKRGFLKGTGVQIIEPGMIGVTPKTYLTSVEGIFSAGDCITGPSTVVEAIKGGKEAAANIDRYLGGDGDVIPKIVVERKLSGEIMEKEQPRYPINVLPLEERLKGFAEVELGYSEEEAIKEACRCLRCDVKK
ncbi:MAG: NADH-quinone oxidoreductase subunit NuoF [Bacillota bacterium]